MLLIFFYVLDDENEFISTDTLRSAVERFAEKKEKNEENENVIISGLSSAPNQTVN